MKNQKKVLPAVAVKLLQEATTRLLMLEQKFGFKFGVYAPDYDVNLGELAEKAKAAPTKRKLLNDAPFGAITAHVRPYLENLQEDEIVKIPLNNFRGLSVYSSAHTLATRLWGKKSAIFELTDTHLEVWRTQMAAGLRAENGDNKEAAE